MARPNFTDVSAVQNIDDASVRIRVEDLTLLASGVFGNVYAGKLVQPDQKNVVIKKTWSRGSKCNIEIKILKILNARKYRNIVQLLYVFTKSYSDKQCNALVFERMQMTLTQYSKKYRAQDMRLLEMIDIKLFTWQLFNAQHHLSQHDICHRDIKPDNIFIDVKKGLLKLGDFGSSIILVEGERVDYYQVTRYYRPPELLLESHRYDTSIDVWSCGCVFGEMLRGSILLRGDSSFQQYEVIVERFGYPTLDDMRAMKCKPDKFGKSMLQTAISKSESHRSSPCLSLLPKAPPEAIVLLEKILVYNPGKRLRGEKLLNDNFFDEIFQPGAKRLGTNTIQVFTPQDLEVMTLKRNRANVL